MPKKIQDRISVKRLYFQLKVKDLERAKKFYEDVFNFEIEWYMSPEIGWCEFNLPGGTPRLGLNMIEEGESINEDSGTFTVEVNDIESAKEYLRGKGVYSSDITVVPNMVSYFNINDTEGNRIQIVATPRIND
jgi:predicted enzyme related to lactoylglutathione lyase